MRSLIIIRMANETDKIMVIRNLSSKFRDSEKEKRKADLLQILWFDPSVHNINSSRNHSPTVHHYLSRLLHIQNFPEKHCVEWWIMKPTLKCEMLHFSGRFRPRFEHFSVIPCNSEKKKYALPFPAPPRTARDVALRPLLILRAWESVSKDGWVMTSGNSEFGLF